MSAISIFLGMIQIISDILTNMVQVELIQLGLVLMMFYFVWYLCVNLIFKGGW